MASGYEMRVGDAEREATAAELREHYASGRLTLDELNERLDKAFAAKTRGDLDALMRDLPSARPRAVGTGTGTGSGAPGAGWTGPGSGWTGPGSGWTGPGSGWTGTGAGWSGPGSGWTGTGARCGAGAGRQVGNAIGQIITMCLLIAALLVVGTLGAFGIGAGRPAGIALLLLALGLLRKLIFGRRRRVVRSRGPRRRRW
jgi:hypothetical protein